MRPTLTLVLLVAWTFFAAGSPETDRSTAGRDADRIRTHLLRVERTLRSASPVDLTREQRTARDETLNWLAEYRARGVYPHNHLNTDARVPVFVDPHGTPCAVAYLLLRSGEESVVEEIVQSDNLIRVPELEGDPRVAAWLESRGITLAEAASIQPTYEPRPMDGGESSYVPVTVGLSLVTAAVASYVGMSEGVPGSPWVDGLAVGAAVSHGFMLLRGGDDEVEREPWVVGLNALGLLVGAASEIVRLNRRARDDVGEEPRSQLFIRQGVVGTEIGVSLVH